MVKTTVVETSAGEPGAKDRTLRLLVAEDAPFIAMDVEMTLTQAGHTVIGPAASVSAALTLIDQQPIDFAFLDVDLQGERVTPVAKRLRTLGIPFVLMTGYEEERLSIPGLERVKVIRKPFDGTALLSALPPVGRDQGQD
ncbi:MAG: response regulator [Rhodospirillales bacterium]|nr:response regulator [Rhodospirillales bacterium]